MNKIEQNKLMQLEKGTDSKIRKKKEEDNVEFIVRAFINSKSESSIN